MFVTKICLGKVLKRLCNQFPLMVCYLLVSGKTHTFNTTSLINFMSSKIPWPLWGMLSHTLGRIITFLLAVFTMKSKLCDTKCKQKRNANIHIVLNCSSLEIHRTLGIIQQCTVHLRVLTIKIKMASS